MGQPEHSLSKGTEGNGNFLPAGDSGGLPEKVLGELLKVADWEFSEVSVISPGKPGRG